jgi:hypothetical protein
MVEELYTNDGVCDIGHDEPPRETPTETQVEAERQPYIGVDGSAISSTEVVVGPFFAALNEPAR